jgi:hypothetical protein
MTTTAGFHENNALLPLLRFSKNNAQQRCRNNGVPQLAAGGCPAAEQTASPLSKIASSGARGSGNSVSSHSKCSQA